MLLPLCLMAIAAAEPEPVTVGVYVRDISDVDLTSFSYRVDFYLWLVWRPRPDFDPTHFEAVNGSDVVRNIEYQTTLDDGRAYRSYRMRGTFRDRFDFQSYPFDRHTLRLSIEDPTLEKDELVYRPDQGTVDRAVTLPSWRVLPARFAVGSHTYQTNFGYGAEGRRETYSQITLAVPIARVLTPYLLKFLLPLLLIVHCAFLVFFIDHHELEVQTGISMTSLLLAIAFHISQADKLPEVSYLITADWFFFVAYLVIFLTLCQTVLCHQLYLRATGRAVAAADRIERGARWAFPAVFYAGFGAIVVNGLL